MTIKEEKQFIKDVMKHYGFSILDYYRSEENGCYICNLHSRKRRTVYELFVDFENQKATIQQYSDCMVHEPDNISIIFRQWV